MKIKIKDVEFIRCSEYSPYSSKANSLGLRYFWRATYGRETIAIADTKAECMEEVRRYIQKYNEE